jgi:Tol biopolymer transport system component
VASLGGEVSNVSTPFACFGIADLSQDRTELLGFVPANTAHDQPLWVLSLATRQAHRVGNVIGRAAAWSPDGQRIAYAVGVADTPDTEMFVTSREGTDGRRIARLEKTAIFSIRWSPDGTRLRIIADHEGGYSTWEVAADGSHLHKLSPIFGRELIDAFWTPDGKYSVFLATREGPGGPDFWVVPEKKSLLAGTGKAIQLTSGAIGFFDTTISPDGKQLYAIGGQTIRGGLVRYDPKHKTLEPFLSGISADQADVSRDGKWVVYVSFPDGALWKCRMDGSQHTQLTQPPLIASLPRWSPDGKSIAFSGLLPPKYVLRIYVVSSDGGERRLVSEGKEHQVNPTWMPDGKTIVFGDSQFASKPQIHTVDLTTGKESIVPGSVGLYDPFVSPDGRFILGHDTPGNHTIMLFDERTQTWSELLDIRKYGPPGIGYPHWSNDGKYVYGTVITAGTHAFSVYRLNMSTRKVDRVIPFEVFGGTIGMFGPLVKVLPDGSPMVLRDLSSQEIYAIDVEWP